MNLTPREQELLALIREAPQSTPEELARRLGTTRGAVNVHVGSLIRKGALLGRGYLLPPQAERVVVVGGANIDFKARTAGPAVAGTSNIGHLSQSVGGVGRNIAENLARLGVSVSLLTAVGADALGEWLLTTTEKAGVDLRGTLRAAGESTGTYTAVLGGSGDLVISVADMGVTERLTPAALTERRAHFGGAAWVVADGNLSPDTLSRLLTLAAHAGAKVAFEPVSVPKAARLLPALESGLAPELVTPNLDELGALVGRALDNTEEAIAQAARELHGRGISQVWVRRGRSGSLLLTPEETLTFPALPAQVADATGAGDSMLAAYLAALLRGMTSPQAAALAHAAAALTIESEHTVLPDLSFERVQARLEEQA